MKRMVETKAVELIEAMQKAGINTESISNTIAVLSGSKDVDDYYKAEGDITISNLPENVECNFAHWRISNGKLSVVIQLFVRAQNSIADALGTQIGEFTIPAWVYNKLAEIPGVTTLLNKTQVFEMYSTPDLTDNYHIRLLRGPQNKLLIYGMCFGSETTFPEVGSARFEFNFII